MRDWEFSNWNTGSTQRNKVKLAQHFFLQNLYKLKFRALSTFSLTLSLMTTEQESLLSPWARLGGLTFVFI